jgi:hypothetical protein
MDAGPRDRKIIFLKFFFHVEAHGCGATRKKKFSFLKNFYKRENEVVSIL